MTRTVALPLILAAGWALGSSQTGQTLEPVRFLRTGHYQLRVDDQLDPAVRVYVPGEGVPRLVIVSQRIAQPILITAGEKTVTPIEAARLTPTPEDPDIVVLAPPDGGPTAPSARLIVDGGRLKAMVAGKRLVVESREPLVGEVQPADLLDFMPEYRRNAAGYAPGKGDVRLLATLTTPTEVEFFFGTWCPHCEQVTPRLIRLMQELQNPALRIHLRATPRQIAEDPLARQFGVNAVPAAVVHRGGEAIAQLDGALLTRPESALATALFGQ